MSNLPRSHDPIGLRAAVASVLTSTEDLKKIRQGHAHWPIVVSAYPVNVEADSRPDDLAVEVFVVHGVPEGKIRSRSH